MNEATWEGLGEAATASWSPLGTLQLGMHPSCEVPLLSFVKQTGDVAIDDAGIQENIPAENTSEIE